MTHLLNLGASFLFSWSVGLSWLLNLIETRNVYLRCLWHRNYIEITWSVMPKPVFLMTVQEAHKDYNSLTDQIQAKYEQLDTPTFKAEACELANLLTRVSQLCQKLNLPPPKELYRPTVFKHWRHFSVLNYRQVVWLGYGGCSFVCRYVRSTRLLSTH